MEKVVVVGGVRTPFVKAAGAFSRYSTLELASHVVRELIQREKLDPAQLQEIALGSVLLDPRVSNLAREVVLRSDLPKTIGGHSLSNNCVTGLVAVSMILDGIRTGRIRNGIAGGAESMSRPSLTFSYDAERFFLSLFRARTIGARLAALAAFRPNFLAPQAPSPKEPSTGKTMGEHCEMTAQELGIARSVQDEIALASHKNAAAAKAAGFLAEEIAPLGEVREDNIIRGDTSIEKLAKLPAVFDRSGKGTLSAGNSSPLTDGASAVLLMSEREAQRLGREPLAYVEGVEFAAIDPRDGLLMAPCVALPRLLARHSLEIDDIDLFEIHEAFGAQVAANLEIWERGWSKYPDARAIGRIPREKINVNGGSIAIGHPFAATGGRLITSLAREMVRRNARTGVISVCAAGAMGAAVLLTRP